MATSAAAVAGAVAARARREVIEYLTGHEAFDSERAVAMEFPSRLHRRQLDLLVRRGIVHDTGAERYWLDRGALRQDEERRKAQAVLLLKIMTVVIFLIAIAVAVAIALH